jgi:nucleotide-binding universal stress UspA family protein
MRIQTILHPTDCTEISHGALNYAATLAHDYGARLIILHAVETLGPENVSFGEAVSQRQPESYRQRLWDDLRRIRLPDPNVPVEYLLSDEDPVSAIIRIAAERDCDLIVVGTHGRHGLLRLLEGSVAERVVRLAACPVLVVKSSELSHKQLQNDPSS